MLGLRFNCITNPLFLVIHEKVQVCDLNFKMTFVKWFWLIKMVDFVHCKSMNQVKEDYHLNNGSKTKTNATSIYHSIINFISIKLFAKKTSKWIETTEPMTRKTFLKQTFAKLVITELFYNILCIGTIIFVIIEVVIMTKKLYDYKKQIFEDELQKQRVTQ